MVNLTWRRFIRPEDTPFLDELSKGSRKWREIELKDLDLPAYMEQYDGMQGEWRIWETDGSPAAISFHLESAPSNQKPWLGTLLVRPEDRRKGIAGTLIANLCKELRDKDCKVLFSAVPIEEYEWVNFLSDCGFEQFKTEDHEDVIYLIMVRPLDEPV